MTHASHSPDDRAAIDFLHDLVAIPSPSGAERAAAQRFIAEARRRGLEASLDSAGNAIALRRTPGAPPDSAPTIALLGHIDTVPGAIPVRIDGDTLHGRGAVDAKGPLAAMLFAAARAPLPDGASIAVIAAVGEETPHSPGARALCRSLRPQACIIGEPSGADAVTLGYKGRLVIDAACAHEEGHSAGAHGSPADALLEWAAGISRWADQRNAAHDPARAFDRIQRTILRMGSDADGLESRAALRVGLRLPPWAPPHDVEHEIRALPATPGVSLAFEGHERAFASRRDDPVVRALSAAISSRGVQPRHIVKTGTSDMNVVAPVWNCPIAAYGPGDSALDHTPHERLDLPEFLRAIATLTDACAAIATELSHRHGVPPAARPPVRASSRPG